MPQINHTSGIDDILNSNALTTLTSMQPNSEVASNAMETPMTTLQPVTNESTVQVKSEPVAPSGISNNNSNSNQSSTDTISQQFINNI